ncbi:hypothetical protein LVR08_29075, partial [Pseudomonas aeruginosa]|uniref:hypothetical protein n=1 Tax=Pseudomonas aeruginosa TaxID=287 RepID=UPI002095FAF4
SHIPFHTGLFWQHFVDMGYLLKKNTIRLPALGVAFFYSLGGFLYLILLAVGQEAHPHSTQAGKLASQLFLCLGVGIAIVSMITSRLCKPGVETGTIPLGGIGMTLTMTANALLPHTSWVYYAALVMTGIFGSIFYVPLM